MPDPTGGSAGMGGDSGTAGAAASGGGAGSAGSGGVGVNEDEPCPDKPYDLVNQCSGDGECSYPDASGFNLCDNLCGSSAHTLTSDEELEQSYAAGKDLILRANLRDEYVEGCLMDGKCMSAPEGGYTSVYFEVDPTNHPSKLTGTYDLVVDVAPPWGLVDGHRFPVACFSETVSCLQMPFVEHTGRWGSEVIAEVLAISEGKPSVTRNIRIRLVDKGTQGCP